MSHAAAATDGTTWNARVVRWLPPTLLFVAALVLNYHDIDGKSFGLDETTSVEYSRQPLGALLTLLAQSDPNMAAYYFILKAWMRVFGEGETAVRSVSALAAALAVPAIYFLGQRLFGRAAGLIAAVLLTLNAFHVQFAQTARAYGLVVLLVILSSHLFAMEYERPSARTRVAYTLVSALAFYTQYFAALVVAVHVAVLIATRRRAAFTKEWVGVAVALAVLCAPELVIASRVGATARLGWVLPTTLERIWWVIVSFAGHSGFVLLALLVAGCYGVVAGARAGRAWPHALVAAWLVVPVVITLIVSLAAPMLVSYYLIVCVPALVLFGSGGLAHVGSRVVRVALVIAVSWSATGRLRDYYQQRADENWRDATRYVLGAVQSGDGIKFFPPYSRRPFDYYHRLSAASGPMNVQRQPLAGHPRVWLVSRGYEAQGRPMELDQMRVQLKEQFRLLERRDFAHVSVELYGR